MKITRNKILFLYGAALGIAVFLWIYGAGVLDVTADAWIFKSDIDLRQHYLGWMAFRNSALSFPFGLIDKLSYPHEISIVYTDSIPLAALFFRLISQLLPATFQYFGLYALLCFILTGGMAALVLGRLSEGYALPMLMAPCFLLSYPMLQRTFYHTSLSSQWIILLCFELWLSGRAKKSPLQRGIIWTALGVLCAGIHLYFLPIALCIMCASLLEECMVNKKAGASCVILPLLMMLGALLTLAAFGAFRISGSGDYWVGDFTMNLNSFFNSLGKTAFLKGLPLWGEMQFEGAVYLGMGLLVMLLCCIIILFLRLKKEGLKTALKGHPRRISMLAAALIFLTVSVLPTVTFGDKLLLRLPYTETMNRVIGIFRSNGRFAWGLMYILIFAMALLLGKVKKRGIVIALAGICLILQAVDYGPWIREKQQKYSELPPTYNTVWDEISLPEGYKGFVMFEKDNTFRMGTAFYAMKHGMTVSNFYFARDISALTDASEEEYKAEILSGNADEGMVYVLDRETYEELKDTGLHFYKTRKCAFGVKAPIAGMEELKDSDLDEIKWREKNK